MVIWPYKSPASEHLPQSAGNFVYTIVWSRDAFVTQLEHIVFSLQRRVAYSRVLQAHNLIPIFVLPSCMVRVPSRMVWVSSHDLLYTSYLFRLLIGSWQSSVPFSRKIQNSIFVWTSGVNFGNVWRGHYEIYILYLLTIIICCWERGFSDETNKLCRSRMNENFARYGKYNMFL